MDIDGDELFDDSGLKVDMSPMIDLVFLLLVFFMTSSTLITIRKDKRVTIPTASSAEVPKLVRGRVVMNLLADGSLLDESGKSLINLEQVPGIMAAAKVRNADSKLHIRADVDVPHEEVKKLIDASRRGGVTSVIFSTYVTDK